MMHESIDHLVELKEVDGKLFATHTRVCGGEEYSRVPVTAERLNIPPILVEYGSIAWGILGEPVALLPVPVPNQADAVLIGDLVDRGPRALATFYKIKEFGPAPRLHSSIDLTRREHYATAKASARGDPKTY